MPSDAQITTVNEAYCLTICQNTLSIWRQQIPNFRMTGNNCPHRKNTGGQAVATCRRIETDIQRFFCILEAKIIQQFNNSWKSVTWQRRMCTSALQNKTMLPFIARDQCIIHVTNLLFSCQLIDGFSFWTNIYFWYVWPKRYYAPHKKRTPVLGAKWGAAALLKWTGVIRISRHSA